MLIADRYELGEEIGAGGMGRVVRATDRNTGRQVAIKLMQRKLVADEASVRRFEREMEAMLRLEHPNIARLYDFGRTDDDELFMVMELIDGESLRDVSETEDFPVERVVRIGQHIARALAAVHANGIVHRDLKPENIMLRDLHGEADWVTILDFGIATLEGSSRVTQTGMVAASPAYCSPEQAKGGTPGPAGDLYMFGVVMYELLTGQLPFEAETQLGYLYAHVHHEPTPLERYRPDTPAWLRELVMELLVKDPDHRPADAAGVLKRLQRGDTSKRAPRERPIIFPDTGMIRSGASLAERTTLATPRRGRRIGLVALAVTVAAVAVSFVVVPGADRAPTAPPLTSSPPPSVAAGADTAPSVSPDVRVGASAETLGDPPLVADTTQPADTRSPDDTENTLVVTDASTPPSEDTTTADTARLEEVRPAPTREGFKISVQSSPPGAKVTGPGGVRRTPFSFVCTRPVTLVFAHENRLDEKRHIPCTQNQSVHVELREP